MNQYDEALKKETAFLGQPRGVGTLSFVQLCSSFSSYAMSAIMIYYLYANAPAGLGFDKADAAQLDFFIRNCSRNDNHHRKLCLRSYPWMS